MLSITTLLLAAGLSLTSVAAPATSNHIDVDCRVDGQLEGALARAKRLNGADIALHGTCKGGIVIATDGVTLRGATPDAGLALPLPPVAGQVLVEIANAQVSLRNLLLRGGEIGVLADGQDAEVLLFGVEMSDQLGGVFARSGARARLIDSTVRDGDVGVLAQFDAWVTLDNVIVTGHDSGVVIFNESRVFLRNSTVENNDSVGLQLAGRCDGGISGGAFRENGQVHIFAGSRSDLTLLDNPVIGSETDTTPAALGVNENASITSFNTPMIHGNVTALDRGSLRIGNTTVDGYLLVSIFSDAYVFNAEIADGVFCQSGSDTVCAGDSTMPSVDGCLSTTCGGPSTATPRPQPDPPQLPSSRKRLLDRLP